MESIFLLIPVGLLFLGLALWLLFRALADGQFDDLDRPAWQVVFDDRDEQRRHEDPQP
ncbi:cbb3-type cytochrome oxidase maturation protein [Alcanivorax sp. S71-1-4]|jgi:cbb3-type cytochrome oxidase maturation protein|uniref:cbb3-type cytochrome oxidase assembly protein CcoS n=1 Tax=Alcanivorax sp. S71-1-4 TaxID=1177159 RepID=UPI001359F1BD|nr:cbb3-type cytochrome oxidase assembly protein CcoS [Alcanivorax sp. S71-1-4]KAF0805515.1 cbb3-type cytochrome oxidase maturation protein [Alcanivorax sp. S71-1-4]